jgi:hypothetical protein
VVDWLPDEYRAAVLRSVEMHANSVFGPTQCRSVFYCPDCRQPFEAFKPV